MKKIFLPIVAAVLFVFEWMGCKVSDYPSNSHPVTHEIWDGLVKKYASTDGKVNYAGFIQDSVLFNSYLKLLKNNHPNDKNWSEKEQLSYWINAYNAFTVKLIVDNYPLKSIKDIKKGLPFINSVWDIKFIKIEGATYDLNNIEHSILRKKFDEPRIHFAINCASVSCPDLRNEAFTADQLENQLTEQAKLFLNNPVKNKITADKIELSSIFSWFKKDFTKHDSLIDFLNHYAPVKINQNAAIDYLDYDWKLNE
jgi:hypothetical protein